MKRTLAILGAVIAFMFIAASPAHATGIVPGAFCKNEDHGHYAQAEDGKWYKCSDTPGDGPWHWILTTSPSPSASPSASGSHSAKPTAVVTSTPTLPVTGSQIPVIAGVGVAAVGLGVVALFVLRRKRSIEFTSE